MDRVKIHKLLDAVLDLFEEETTTDESPIVKAWAKGKKMMPTVTDHIHTNNESAQPSGTDNKISPYILHLTLGTIYKIVREGKDTYDVEFYEGELKKSTLIFKKAVNDFILTHLTEEEARQILPVERSSRPFLINKLRNW